MCSTFHSMVRSLYVRRFFSQTYTRCETLFRQFSAECINSVMELKKEDVVPSGGVGRVIAQNLYVSCQFRKSQQESLLLKSNDWRKKAIVIDPVQRSLPKFRKGSNKDP